MNIQRDSTNQTGESKMRREFDIGMLENLAKRYRRRRLMKRRMALLSVLVLLGPPIVFAWRVVPLPEEVRRRIHHHHGAH